MPEIGSANRWKEGRMTTDEVSVLLEALETFYRKYAVHPTEHHYVVLVLWTAHSYVYEEFDTSPRLFFDSAVPACGKTRNLELLDETARSPLMAFSASPAALIRTIDKGGRTILMDEIDTLYNKNGGAGSEDVTAVVNAGYKNGARVPRCVGQGMDIDVVELDAYAPMALAGLHSNVPEAVRSRSIHFRMKKRKPSEVVSPFYRRDVSEEAQPLREGLAEWLEPLREEVRAARPRMPKGVEDRAAEVWEPLLVIADLADGQWPKRAREACKHFVFAKSGYARPIGIDLLADIQLVFKGAERMASADLVAALVTIPDAPWKDIRGSFLNQATLANFLRPFDVRPKDLKFPGNKVVKGYRVGGEGGLAEAWERNLAAGTDDVDDDQNESIPALIPPEAATAATGATALVTAPEVVAPPVAGSGGATYPATNPKPLTSKVAGVAGVAPPQGMGGENVATAANAKTPLHAVSDPTCREWFERHIRGLIENGHTTVDSDAVYTAGQDAGWNLQNLRKVASKSTLVGTAEKRADGTALWNIGEEATDTWISAPQWLLDFLRAHGGWVRASEVHAAAQADPNGPERTSLKSAARAAYVQKRGNSIATEWCLDPSHEQESA
ncbi:hypothetical protein AOT96_28565 [Rhodococcus sp. 008]|nr:hypothetical protein AOT96_28565 [Rhodococcus sp. 008]